jgi:hypothetical protein
LNVLLSARRQSVLPALLLALLVPLLVGPVGAAQAGSLPAPTRIEIDFLESPRLAPPDTPPDAVPNLLVQTGDVIEVHVSFWDGVNPAAFNKDTVLRLTSNVGSLTVLDATALAGQSTATLTASISDAVNQVAISVDDLATGRKAADIQGDTADQVFDVLRLVVADNQATGPYERGIGGQQECTTATREEPVCGFLSLPFGAQAGQVVLSTGTCGSDQDAYAPCLKGKGVVLQVLAGMDDLGYGPTTPATLVVRCDKSLCGSGAIRNSSLNFSLDGNGNLGDVVACPAKGTLPGIGVPCLDYVQSKRDGSGDTHLYFLFDKDARVSVG